MSVPVIAQSQTTNLRSVSMHADSRGISSRGIVSTWRNRQAVSKTSCPGEALQTSEIPTSNRPIATEARYGIVLSACSIMPKSWTSTRTDLVTQCSHSEKSRHHRFLGARLFFELVKIMVLSRSQCSSMTRNTAPAY